MVFSSVEFLFLFLPLALAAHLVAPRPARNAVLLAFSMLFYTWGGGSFLGILLGSVALNYGLGYVAGEAADRGDLRRRNQAVALSVVANLALLGYYKYANFFVDELDDVLLRLGAGDVTWTPVVLPIGISFFTFHSMSYTIDIGRGRSQHLRNPIDYALYIVLFPQLISGPIIRYHEIAAEIRDRRIDSAGFAEGAMRFCYGLSKKVLVADTLAPVADAAFDTPASGLSSAGAAIGILAYTMQIYFDFSGYTDMAIGLARMLGFHFPENFRRPYSALSITDFWRRWHITLSNWFRDYVYVPLGGNRGSSRRTMVNLSAVFLLTGIWHGAAFTFVLWGALHGAVMLWERWRGTRWVDDAPNEVRARLRTFAIVSLAWVLFRAVSVPDAVRLLGSLGGLGAGPLADDPVLRATDLKELLVLVGALATLAMPRDLFIGQRLAAGSGRPIEVGRLAVLAVGFPLAVVYVVSGTFSPFLYFQF